MRPERLTLEQFKVDAKTIIEYYTVAIVAQTRGRKPKAGSLGDATIPYALGKELLEFYETTWKEGWLFDGKTRGMSMQKKQAENISNAAIMKALEIDDAARRERGLTFHAWRWWYVTHIRAATDKDFAQKLARHKSAAMTDHYTHLTDEQKQESARAELEIFGKMSEK